MSIEQTNRLEVLKSQLPLSGIMFPATLKSITLKNNERSMGVSFMSFEDAKKINNQLDAKKDFYEITIFIPIEQRAGSKVYYKEIKFVGEILESILKEKTQSIKIKIGQKIVQALNEIIEEWSEDILFCFERRHPKLELGDSPSIIFEKEFYNSEK